MKAWRSLRMRLIFSYIILAFLLLSFVGYVFSNALFAYAHTVQETLKAQYMNQALSLLSEAKNRNFSQDDTLALLRQSLPDVIVEQMASKPIINVTPSKTIGEDGSLLSAKTLFISSEKPGNSSFTLQTFSEYKGTSSALFYQFTLHPSAFGVLSQIYRQILEILVLALILAGFIGWLLSRWLGQPLSRLAAATESVAAGDFQEMVGHSGIIELDRVVEQFNRMVLYLRESFISLATERDTAQRFAADAAHELKTPVATLRAYQDVISENPERLNQALPAIGRQIERMEQVISGLLKIATLDNGSDFTLKITGLCSFIHHLEPIYEALAAEDGHALSIAYPEAPIHVILNIRLLELALDNIMDNACKYSPPGGKMSLTLQIDGKEALITVEDAGKGIAEEELPYIFDRFRRGVDTQSVPGTGLGLAIARESLKRMSGTISVESKVNIGTRFIIRLPLQPT